MANSHEDSKGTPGRTDADNQQQDGGLDNDVTITKVSAAATTVSNEGATMSTAGNHHNMGNDQFHSVNNSSFVPGNNSNQGFGPGNMQNPNQMNNQFQPNHHFQPNYYHNNYGYHMGQNQNFQPSAAQPLAYPNYGGYCGPQQNQFSQPHQNQYPPFYQHNGGYPPQQVQMPPPPPPQPAFAPPPPPPLPVANPTATNHSGNDDTTSDNGTDNGTDQGESEQFSGQLSDKLDAWMAQIKEKPTEGPAVCEKLARYMTYQLEQGFITADLDYSIKEYPPLKNVPLAWAPELESDIFSHTRFQNNKSVVATEVALKSIQRGIASALNALGPLSEIIMRQSYDNPALDDASTAIVDIIKYLANSLGGITKKRRDLLKPAIDNRYHQRLGKKDEDFEPRFLFGGNIGDRVRKYKATDSLMKEVMKPDPKSNSNQPRKSQPPSASNGGGHNQGGRASHRSQPYPRSSGSGSGSRSNGNTKPRQDFRNGGSHQQHNNNGHNNKNSTNRNNRS